MALSRPLPVCNVNQICMVIDLEGWFVKKGIFIHRELGYCDHTGYNYGTFHYMPFIRYDKLSKRDQHTVRYAIENIHGLSYYPHGPCSAVANLTTDLGNLYNRFRTPDKYSVGYKGGRVEFDLLKLLGIQGINLEVYGCPKFDQLPRTTAVGTCDQHRDPTIHHCSQTECYTFVNWIKQQC